MLKTREADSDKSRDIVIALAREMCGKRIRFGEFVEKARAKGATVVNERWMRECGATARGADEKWLRKQKPVRAIVLPGRRKVERYEYSWEHLRDATFWDF